jgi:hypothetical protein
MCNVHFMRAVLKNMPKKDKKEVAYMLKDALEDEAKMQKLAVIRNYNRNSLSFSLDNNFPVRWSGEMRHSDH